MNSRLVLAWNDLGAVLTILQRYDEAETAFRKALEVDAKYVTAWDNLGVVLRCLKKHDEAEKALRRAAELRTHR